MNGIPVLGFAAYSGTGKTTLIEKIVFELKKKGLRIAVVKHDGHDFDIDHEGKDSWRFSRAGADISIVASARKIAYIEQCTTALPQVLSMVHGVDLILVEGYKHEPISQIGICRRETGKGFAAGLERYVAVVTDLEERELLEMGNDGIRRPRFSFDEAEAIAEFIVKHKESFTRVQVKSEDDITWRQKKGNKK